MKQIACVLALAGVALAAEPHGRALSLSKPTPLASILKTPGQYVGKTIQVRGKVTEVCQMMGCWLQIVDQDQSLRIKVTDGEIRFPADSVGRTVTAEGVLQKFQLTREQAVARARHEAEEQNRKFNPQSIRSGTTIYQIQASGAVLEQ